MPDVIIFIHINTLSIEWKEQEEEEKRSRNNEAQRNALTKEEEEKIARKRKEMCVNFVGHGQVFATIWRVTR